MPNLTTLPSEIAPYLTDESSAFVGSADRLYRPTGVSEIGEILREASELRTPVTTSGAGTSITGARVPTVGGWILATDQLRDAGALFAGIDSSRRVGSWERLSSGDATILVNRDQMRARVPAGVRLSEVDEVLGPTGLFYPPDPTEMTAMIGGTVATNASGARSYHYGATRAWIEALVVVTPAGDAALLRRGEPREPGDTSGRRGMLNLGIDLPRITIPKIDLPANLKNAAGYYLRPDMDAVDLFIGGEGTLGVVAAAEVRLAPRQLGTVTLTAFLASLDGALDLADDARSGSFGPGVVLSIEFFDASSLDLMRGTYPEIPQAAAAVVIELSGDTDASGADKTDSPHLFGVDAHTSAMWQSALSRFATVDVWATLPNEREQMRLFRHSLPEGVNEYVRSRHGKLGTDLAVPATRFREMVDAYEKASGEGIRTVLFGHLGDHHLHLNFLAESSDELARAHEIYASLAHTAIDLGGTISAEHGVGKKRINDGAGGTIPYLELMFGTEGVRAMQEVKRQIDPAWILNRGTMLPEVDPP